MGSGQARSVVSHDVPVEVVKVCFSAKAEYKENSNL